MRSHKLDGEVEIHLEMALDGIIFVQHKHSIGVSYAQGFYIPHLLNSILEGTVFDSPRIKKLALFSISCCPRGRNL